VHSTLFACMAVHIWRSRAPGTSSLCFCMLHATTSCCIVALTALHCRPYEATPPQAGTNLAAGDRVRAVTELPPALQPAFAGMFRCALELVAC